MLRIRQSQRQRILGLYIPLAIALVQMVRVWTFTIDDAYISYRYARNLARGWGLVYNFGDRVEGYTNFLWTVILAGVDAVGIDIDLGAKVLGAGCSLLSLVLVYQLAERTRRFTRVPCLATWVVASSMTFSGYAVFGLETALYVLLILAGTLQFMNETRAAEEASSKQPSAAHGWRRWPWSGLVFGFAALTRPEAPLFIGLLMLMLPGPRLLGGADRGVPSDPKTAPDPAEDTPPPGFDRRAPLAVSLAAAAWLYVGYRSLEQPVWATKIGLGVAAVGAIGGIVASLPRALFARANWLRGAVFSAVVAIHLVWRHSYYGHWLPNTVLAKTGDMNQQLALGTTYALEYLQHESALVVLVLLGVAAALLWRHTLLWVAVGVVSLASAYVVLVGGDWMPLFRFFGPVLPFVGLLAGVGTRAVLERRDRLVTLGLGLVIALVAVQRWRRGEADIRDVYTKHERHWNSTAKPIVKFFAERQARFGDDARGVIAMGDIGEVGYETDYPVLDLLGLVDSDIAHQPGGYGLKVGKGYTDHFFAVRPRYLLLISNTADCLNPHHPSFRSLYYDRRFRPIYRVVFTVPVGSWGWCIFEDRALIPPKAPSDAATK